MSTYVLRYFPIKARAETCRALLSYSGASYTNEAPAWPQEKSNQPFGKLPVLIETDESGATFKLSDSLAIEHYLATKYGLMVDSSPQDRACQDELRHQIKDIYEFIPQYRFGNEDTRASVKEKLDVQMKYFIEYHENHLKNNGSNGHYFGDKTTYVDIALVASMRAVREFGASIIPGLADWLSPDNAPLINKVIEVVGADPKLVKYFNE
ncbi:hypothetical protein DL89DRAFT_256161 [Linderina pennispora]|uniref:Glutathione S-transferase n=1 Tax=Linderina pennispora TaxID=61395 RepID=A0A1Y1WC23_9FUNG|nr:uncharacterized protein DL89DRAFT_256161 [Linderina pennispora]ORX71100.1 hypothetical protein DL89DRAFT_256161 [Linderina pennispora]